MGIIIVLMLLAGASINGSRGCLTFFYCVMTAYILGATFGDDEGRPKYIACAIICFLIVMASPTK